MTAESQKPPGGSVAGLLATGRQSLGSLPGAALEAEVLLAHVLGAGRAWLFANGDTTLTPRQQAAFVDLLQRRGQGEPVAYLVGEREFWSLPIRVTPDVLIPRPETELLVETALEFIPADARWRIADLGTGSGAVAIALACERPGCEVHATEISTAALAVAEANVRALAPGRVHLHRGSWLEPLQGRFRAIVSNPPYVAGNDPHLGEGDCRFEPRPALTPGEDGLEAIRIIVAEAGGFLEPGGLLAFEHGCGQGEAARKLLREYGFAKIGTFKDLENRERVTCGVRPGSG